MMDSENSIHELPEVSQTPPANSFVEKQSATLAAKLAEVIATNHAAPDTAIRVLAGLSPIADETILPSATENVGQENSQSVPEKQEDAVLQAATNERNPLIIEKNPIQGSPELRFLTNGNLVRLAIKDPLRVANIARSIMFGRPRSFAKDSEHLARNFEPAVILGRERIPKEAVPLVIACNHPDLYDLVQSVIQITEAVSETKQAENAQSNTH